MDVLIGSRVAALPIAAYATNGPDIIVFDYSTGLDTVRANYPKPDELWQRYRASTV